MTKRTRIALWIGGGLLLAAVVALFAVYRATQYVPDFYRQALEVDPNEHEKASDEMLQLTAALVSDVKTKDRWQARFTAAQINGWLAWDLPRNYPKSLPASIRDPRVAIEKDEMTLACTYTSDGFESVLSLAVDPYLPLSTPDVIALRIRRARAGLVGLPLQRVLDGISQAARSSHFRLEWGTADGDPVALIALPEPHDGRRRVRLETLQLRDGEIYMVGTAERRK